MKLEKRFFIKIIAFFMLLILLFLILFISIKNVRANNRAVKYFNKGNFESAAKTFDNELKNNPKNYVVINNSAGADYKLNKLDEAKAKYAVVLNSTDAAKEDKFAALYGTGNVEFLKNNFEKSAEFYREALKLNPNDKDAKYNLELVLLKLNEKNNKQDNKDDKQKNDKQKQNQQAQDLKRQMEQNDKAQKENEKERQEEKGKSGDNKDASSQRSDNDKQKELEKEKKELDKQRQEISDKIKNLMKAQKEEKFQEDKQADKSAPMKQNKIKKDVNKDMQAVMLLNYYNEADKNSNKVVNKNKEHLINQPQEDW